MDKEKEAYEILLKTINTLARNAAATEKRQYQHQTQLLHDIRNAAAGNADIANDAMTQLAQLLADVSGMPAGNDDAWLVWLNGLLGNKTALPQRSDRLIAWLLQRVEQQPQNAHAWRCVCTLLELLAAEAARAYWPQLAAMSTPATLEAACLYVHCLDTAYNALCAHEAQPTEADSALAGQLADALMSAHYEGLWLQQTAAACSAGDVKPVCQLLVHTLRLLQQITTQQAAYAEQHAPELLGFVLATVQFGLGSEEPPVLRVPQRIQPAQQAATHQQQEHSVPRSGRQAKARKLRSIKKQRHNGALADKDNLAEPETVAVAAATRTEEMLLLGNDCDNQATGDSEGWTTAEDVNTQLGLGRQLQHCSKVRLNALRLLGAVTKQLPRRALYGYWHVLFPSEHSMQHLLHLGQSDSNARCRALALQVAAQLLYGSKTYLCQASSAAPSNYTPFVVSLATSVLSAYRTLSSILEREYVPPVLVQCLKCLAVLVQATPFEQLEMGFVYQFVPHVKKLCQHPDKNVQVSALLVMEMLVATPRLTQEIACAVGLPHADQIKSKLVYTSPRLNERELAAHFEQLCVSDCEDEPDEENANQRLELLGASRVPRNCWLLRYVLRFLESTVSLPPLRVECLQVLLAMASHFPLLHPHLHRLCNVLCNSLTDNVPDVRLYAARTLDAVAYQMSQHVPEQPEQLRQQHVAFWLQVLPSIYAAYLKEVKSSLRCALCDALSHIGGYSFERLPRNHRNGLLAFLSGCSSDDNEERLVRAAALRALAVYVLLPMLRSDLVFVENTAELTLRLLSDTQLAVRVKAAWALGNISEALLGPSNDTQLELELPAERISDELLRRLIAAATQACTDHDKVRANAVRALGSLLRLLAGPQLHTDEARALTQAAITKLIDCVRFAGSAKVKWNACYAIGNLVRNRALFAASTGTANVLFPAICQLIVQHANFKVRINATTVVLHVAQRADFGAHFAAVWSALVAAVERSNVLDNYEEYNHRDALQQQLCLALAHLLESATLADLPACRASLEQQLDVVSCTWRRVAHRMLPELSTPLFICAVKLQQRLQPTAAAGSAEQRNALSYMVRALQLDTI